MSATHDFKVKNGLDVLNITQGYKLNGTTVLNYSGGNIELGDLGAGVNLHYSGSTKLATTSSGVAITGNATATNLYVTEDIGHSGDSDTYISFDNNTHTYYAGGTRLLDFAPGSVIFNEGGGDVDFRVESTGSANMLFVNAGANQVGVGCTSINPDVTMQVERSGSNAYIRVVETGNTGIDFGQETNGNGIINLRDSASLRTFIGGSERTTLTSAGNLGIGTTSPNAKLEIKGASSTNYLQFNNSSDTELFKIDSNFTWTWGTTAPDNIAFDMRDNSGNAFFALNRSNGRVGIGTTTPISTFHIKGDAKEIYLSSTDYNIARIIPRGTGTNLDKGLFSLFDTSVEDIRLDVGGVSWIDTAANVGIGTKNPDYTLDVTGSTGSYTSGDLPIAVFQSATDHRALLKIQNNNENDGASAPRAGLDLDVKNEQSGNRIRAILDLKKKTNSGSYGNTDLSVPYDFNIFVNNNATITTSSGSQTSSSLTAGTQAFTVTAGGNVGIGASSPQTRLHVESSDGSGIRVSRSGASAYMQLFPAYSNVPTIMGLGAGGLHLGYNSDTAGIRIATNNNVGIGTTDPAHKLQVETTGAKAFFLNRNSGSNAANLNEFSTHYSLSILNRTSGSYLNFGGTSNKTDIQATDGAGSATAKSIALNPFGGNVGIGTVNALPNAALTIRGTGTSGSQKNTIAFGTTGWGNPTGPGTALDGAVKLALFEGGTQKVQIGMDANARLWLSSCGSGASGIDFYTGASNTDAPSRRLRIDQAGLASFYAGLNVTGRVGLNQTALANNFTLQVTGMQSNGSDARVMYLKGAGTATSIGSTGPTLVLQNTNNTANNIVKLSFESASAGETVSINAINTNHTSHYGDMAFNTRGSSGYSEKMRIMANGNVGIGTDSPGRKLHLKDGQIKFQNTGSGGWAGLDFSMGNGTYDGYMGMLDNNGSFFIDVDSNGNDLVILQNGNVGIGTSAPFADFEVQGDEFFMEGGNQTKGPGIFLGNPSFGNASYYNSAPGIGAVGPYGGVSGGLGFYTYGGGSNSRNEHMRIDDSGNVGIGTSAPAYKFDVYGTDDITMRIHRPSSGLSLNDTCGIGFSHRGDTNTSTSDTRAAIVSTYNGSLHLCTEPGGNLSSNPVDHAALSIIGTNQNVGIGTTAPPYQLSMKHASGPTLMMTRTSTNTSGSIGEIIFGNNDWDSSMASIRAIQDGTNDGAKLEFKTQYNATGGEVTRMLINKSGQVAIGGAPQESDTLTVTTTTTDGSLRLVNSNTGSGSTRFVIENRSTSPAANDGIGEIQFIGKNSAGNANGAAYVSVIAEDVTNGSYDSSMNISTLVAGYIRNRIRFTPTQTVVNEDSVALNFRVESNNNDNMIHVDGTNDRVGIGRVPATHPLEVQGHADFKSSMAVTGTVTSVNGLHSNHHQAYQTGTDGWFITTNVASNNYGHIHGQIKIQQFNFNTQQIIDFSATVTSSGTVHTQKATADIPITIKMFVYSGVWCFHIPSPSTYSDASAYIHMGNGYQGSSRSSNAIISLTAGTQPSSGVSASVDMIPQVRGSDYSSTLNILNNDPVDGGTDFDQTPTDNADGGGTTWSISGSGDAIFFQSTSGGHSGNFMKVNVEAGWYVIKGAVRLTNTDGAVHSNTSSNNYKYTHSFRFYISNGPDSGTLKWDADALASANGTDFTRAAFCGQVQYLAAGNHTVVYSTNGYNGVQQIYITDLQLARVG